MNFSTFRQVTRFEQTFFGLPFLVSAILLPLAQQPKVPYLPFHSVLDWLWILIAFLAARVSGMAFNQWIDRRIDARNPRTASRALPSGRATSSQVISLAWIALACFILACWKMGPLCGKFAFPAAALLIVYSFLKRVHYVCHFALGMIHFLSPLMAWIAATGNLGWTPIFLGMTAWSLVTGNDILYALQDEAFDRAEGLQSIPARVGTKKSLQIARVVHLFCPLSLAAMGISAQLPILFYLTPMFVTAMLVVFHRSVAKGSLSLERLFFLANTSVSCCVLMFIIGCVVWRVLL